MSIKKEVKRLKMKKGLTVLIAMVIIFGIISAGAADDLLIGREFQVEGTGVISAELRIDTGTHHPGIKLGEDLSTPGGGYNGLSKAQYSSSFEVGLYGEGENFTSELGYVSNAQLLNAKRSLHLSDYVIGGVMGFKSIGNSEQDIEMYSDNSGMGTDLGGKILGRMKIFNKVVDTRDHHSVVVSDRINMDGNYTYELSLYNEWSFYPEDGNGDDWLGCP